MREIEAGIKAVNSIIAVVALLAVAVAVAMAAAMWTTSITSSQQNLAGPLLLLPDSYINTSDRKHTLAPTSSLHIHVLNQGNQIRVYSIEVTGVTSPSKLFYLLQNDTSLNQAYAVTGGALTSIIPAHFRGWLIVDLNEIVEPGSYVVKVYTSNGVFTITVTTR